MEAQSCHPRGTDAREPFTNTVTHLRRHRAGVGQDDCELIAAKPGHDIGFIRARRMISAALTSATPGLVPMLVVDALETIEVHEQQRRGRPEREARLASRRSTWFR